MGEENLGVNPFCNTLEIHVRTVSMPNQFVRSGDYILNNIVGLETTPITKVFATADRRKIIEGLSGTSSRIWLKVMYSLEHGKDFVKIDTRSYMKAMGIKSELTFRNALKELVRYGLLALTTKRGFYWINPDFIFQGDRIKKYPNNVKSSGQ